MATAKKNVRAARLKRADRKNISVGQAHIRSTFNNTIVSITDPQGNVGSPPVPSASRAPVSPRRSLPRWLPRLLPSRPWSTV